MAWQCVDFVLDFLNFDVLNFSLSLSLFGIEHRFRVFRVFVLCSFASCLRFGGDIYELEEDSLELGNCAGTAVKFN